LQRSGKNFARFAMDSGAMNEHT